MASKTQEKLNNLYKQARLLFYAGYLRYFFGGYCILCFLCWFLNCLEVEWVYKMAWMFEVPYAIISKFYTPEGISSADFSLPIIGVISLFLAFAVNFFVDNKKDKIYESIEIEEERFEKEIEARKKALKAKQINKNAQKIKQLKEKQNPSVTVEASKLLLLIMPQIKKIKQNKSDLDFTFKEIDDYRQKINMKLLQILNYSKPLQKGYYKKNLFMLFKEFNFTDEFLNHLGPTMTSIFPAFRQAGIQLNFCYVFSTLDDIKLLEKELDFMDTVLSLNFVGEYIATHKFKTAYSNLSIKKYKLELKGEYNISKNLSVSNKQPLYDITTPKKGAKTNANENN